MEHISIISNTIIIIFTALTCILTFIEKSQHIKWKPLTSLFTSDLDKKIDKFGNQIDTFKNKLDEIENDNDIREIKRLRQYIQDYATERTTLGIPKSQEQERYFDDCCEDYEKLLEKHKLTNGHTTQSIHAVIEYRKLELSDKYNEHKNI